MAAAGDRKARLAAFAGRRIARWIRLVSRTSTIVTEPADIPAAFERSRPAIAATWHGQFLMIPALRLLYPHPMSAMVARHGDAELIGQALGFFDVGLIRGAGAGGRRKDRGGAYAYRNALRALDAGTSLFMTADVPPGPARVAGLGIVAIARASGRPILPMAAVTSRFKVLDTWSRITINMPFSKLAYVVGDPILVPEDASDAVMEEKRAEVEAALDRVTARAYELVGADVRRIAPKKPMVPTDPALPPPSPGLGLGAYRAGTRLIGPAAPLLLGWRARRGKEDPRRQPERLGQASQARPDGPLIWAHAASVGETNALLPALEALLAQRGDLSILLTTGTVTSAALAGKRLPGRMLHQFVPIDTPQHVARFLDHWRPDLGLFIESEVWPNMILGLTGRRIPLALVNARMSARSQSRWSKADKSARALFGRFDVIVAQSDAMAERFRALGGRRVIAAGNLKIDAPPPPVDQKALARLKELTAGRPILVAASTHDGEEETIAAAHRTLAQRLPGFLTIVVPRHPERGTMIAEMLRGKGIAIAQRSTRTEPAPETGIYVADTLGELGTFYALSPVAFVGGSLATRGGQNPIEAVRHGAVVLTGPNWENFREAYTALIGSSGAIEVRDADQIADAVVKLYTEEGEMARRRAGAEAALASLSGALSRTTPEIFKLLDARLQQEQARAGA